METVELIKAWSALPIGAVLGFLLWQLIKLVNKIVLNHMTHLQENTEIIKDGIHELKGSARETIVHLSMQTELLKKIADK
mgnify:CR=1 FL=1